MYKEFIAKAVTLPGEGEIMDLMEVADPDAVHAVRSFIRKELARQLNEEFLSTVSQFCLKSTLTITQVNAFHSQVISNRSLGSYEFNHENMTRRALKNVALGVPLVK